MIINFESGHIKKLDIQHNQSEMLPYLELENYGDILKSAGQAYSLFDGETLIACAGLAEQSPNRALGWALISKYVKGYHFVSISKFAKDIIGKCSYGRVEVIVRDKFDEAHRWARMLGFRCETPEGMLNWFRDGSNAYLYAVTK